MFQRMAIALKTFQKILCPIDFSPASYAALRVAIQLSDANITEICVLHVGPPSRIWTAIDQNLPAASNEAGQRAETVRKLCAVLDERVPTHLRTRPVLKAGDVAEEILRTAQEEQVDLIVLTTHGAGSKQGDTLGQVATVVANRAQCPVLIINPFDYSCAHAAQPDKVQPTGPYHSMGAGIETELPHPINDHGDVAADHTRF